MKDISAGGELSQGASNRLPMCPVDTCGRGTGARKIVSADSITVNASIRNSLHVPHNLLGLVVILWVHLGEVLAIDREQSVDPVVLDFLVLVQCLEGVAQPLSISFALPLAWIFVNVDVDRGGGVTGRDGRMFEGAPCTVLVTQQRACLSKVLLGDACVCSELDGEAS